MVTKQLAKQQTAQQKWSAEIAAAEKELEKFHKRAEKVTKRFLDERDGNEATHKWFNVYYANVNIMEAALYAQPPKPAVSRKFKDYEDDTSRLAALILQRSIMQDLDDPRDTFDATLRQCVQDRLIPGLSMAWLRLETDTEDINPVDPQELTEDGESGVDVPTTEIEPMKTVTDQRVCVDYVFWKDFIWSPCRVYDERRWVGRKVYLTKEKLVKRFGQEKADLIPMDGNKKVTTQVSNASTPENNAEKEACVYEIWDRTTKKVFWFSKEATDILDEQSDPLKLTGFEPCPRPMFANITTSNTVPRPDYYMIQDQYNELDTLNNRISLLIRACKVVGVYDKASPGIARMLKEGTDNDLIPVDNWAMFAEKNGLKGQIDWLPLETVIQAIQRLNEAREVIKAQIYELTGISDIVRGASKASETLGAQEIKSQFASIRIKKLQDEVARFASEVMRIKAEIMVGHFDPKILVTKSNIAVLQEDPELIVAALDMLQSAVGFEWRIEITADSIALADYAMEKKDRIEFLTAVGDYLSKAAELTNAIPGIEQLLMGMLKWAVAGFRNAAEIEGMIDKHLDELANKPPPEPPQDPEVIKAQTAQKRAEGAMQIEVQKAQAKIELDKNTAAAQGEINQAKSEADLALRQREAEVELQRKIADADFQSQRLATDSQRMADETRQAEAKARLELEQIQQKNALELQYLTEKFAIELQNARDKAAATLSAMAKKDTLTYTEVKA